MVPLRLIIFVSAVASVLFNLGGILLLIFQILNIFVNIFPPEANNNFFQAQMLNSGTGIVCGIITIIAGRLYKWRRQF